MFTHSFAEGVDSDRAPEEYTWKPSTGAVESRSRTSSVQSSTGTLGFTVNVMDFRERRTLDSQHRVASSDISCEVLVKIRLNSRENTRMSKRDFQVPDHVNRSCCEISLAIY